MKVRFLRQVVKVKRLSLSLLRAALHAALVLSISLPLLLLFLLWYVIQLLDERGREEVSA